MYLGNAIYIAERKIVLILLFAKKQNNRILYFTNFRSKSILSCLLLVPNPY